MTKRTHTLEWDDPSITARAAPTMSGMEFLNAISKGELPAAPMAIVMNLRFIEITSGRILATAQPGEYLYNPIGVIHGGFTATLLDTVMACSIHSTLPAGSGYTTIEIKVNMVRPITLASGLLYAEGKVIHGGKRIATAEGTIKDAEGKLYAHGTTTCMILES
ncbi:MAG TPA: PaaI family thioesterase [Phototrophicaceae bacterium]|jgi:uncharacterized protein (TIGR00369 family)|nr:PaaI family thioesterase [Phototrophicaceae bacterium]